MKKKIVLFIGGVVLLSVVASGIIYWFKESGLSIYVYIDVAPLVEALPKDGPFILIRAPAEAVVGQDIYVEYLACDRFGLKTFDITDNISIRPRSLGNPRWSNYFPDYIRGKATQPIISKGREKISANYYVPALVREGEDVSGGLKPMDISVTVTNIQGKSATATTTVFLRRSE